jgi:hypothetical protein
MSLNTYRAESFEDLDGQRSQIQAVTVKIRDGDRKGKLYYGSGSDEIVYECDVNVYKSAIVFLVCNDEMVNFDKPVPLDQNNAVVEYKNKKCKITLKYYDSETSVYQGTSSVSGGDKKKCPQCGKDKESIDAGYCNACLAKATNTCPKCGKQEANASITWCSRCRSLKCPRCQVNVRTHTFKALCSECERKERFNR